MAGWLSLNYLPVMVFIIFLVSIFVNDVVAVAVAAAATAVKSVWLVPFCNVFMFVAVVLAGVAVDVSVGT